MIIDGYNVELIDDGTLDTVFRINGVEVRYDSDYIARTQDGVTKAGYQQALKDYLDDLANDLSENPMMRGE